MGTHRELLEQSSEIYLDNIDQCIRHRADINTIFDTTEEATKELYKWIRHVLSNCENVCSIHASGILFVTLVSLSHFTQNSMYVHWKEAGGLKNINLFGLIVGLSGSDKSGLINIIHSCYKTCELLFPDIYIVDGKKSIINDVTGAGLHKEFSNGSKFLLMHEADANLTKLGFYHHGQVAGVSTRSLLCEAFDGFTESSKTTGMYDFIIKNARLSLLGATTGGTLHLLLAYYATHKISDGCDNRFLYYFIENDLIPYDLVKKSDQFSPSLQQVFVVIHLIGNIIYTFIDPSGNDESQRFYVSKGRYYIEEGRRIFRERQQPHLQSFYSKSAELFPRLCVSMQRFIDAMTVLLEMKQNADLEFSQTVDQAFVLKAKTYVQLHLNTRNYLGGHVSSHVSLETCQITATLFDKFLFKTTIALFNLERSSNQSSMPSNNFRSLLSEKISNEKRLLQLPFQFFLRSDLKQPTINDEGKKINGPFHHIDGNELNQLLDKLVNQKLLRMGNFIARPRAQASHSYMKSPIPDDPDELEQFVGHLEQYKIKLNEYQCLLTRSTLPNKCILLPDAVNLLTSSSQHIEDCLKYGLTTTANHHNTDGNGTQSGDRNIGGNDNGNGNRNVGGNGNGNENGDKSDDRNVGGNSDQGEDRNGNGNGDRSDDRNLSGNGEDQYDDMTDKALFDEICALITPIPVPNGIQEQSNTKEKEIDILNKKTRENNITRTEELNSGVLVHGHHGHSRDVLLNQMPTYGCDPNAPRAFTNKTPDAQPKEIDNNYIGNNNDVTQVSNTAGSGTDNTTHPNNDNMDVNSHVKAILQYPSIILSASDIALATRRASPATRKRVVGMMIEKGLLREDNYFIRQLAKRTKLVTGFAKQVPSINDETARFTFIRTLNEFDISWDTFKSYFDLTKEGFRTTTQFQLSEVAESLLDSDDYKSFVRYDKSVVFRIIDNETTQQDELESGANVTGIQTFESLGKGSMKRKGSSDLRRSKRNRK